MSPWNVRVRRLWSRSGPVCKPTCYLLSHSVLGTTRCKAVPGILDAILIDGEVAGASESLQKAKEEWLGVAL